MTVKEMAEQLKLTVLSGENGLNKEVKGGYVSDLLSDVMGHAKEGQVWITLQNHINVMAIASLKDLSAVILINGIRPAADMAAQSIEEGIPVLGTTIRTFEMAGALYELLRNEGIHG